MASESFDEDAVANRGLVAGRIDGMQLEKAPTFLGNENRLGERAVGGHGYLFTIDLQNRAGFGAAGAATYRAGRARRRARR